MNEPLWFIIFFFPLHSDGSPHFDHCMKRLLLFFCLNFLYCASLLHRSGKEVDGILHTLCVSPKKRESTRRFCYLGGGCLGEVSSLRDNGMGLHNVCMRLWLLTWRQFGIAKCTNSKKLENYGPHRHTSLLGKQGWDEWGILGLRARAF